MDIHSLGISDRIENVPAMIIRPSLIFTQQNFISLKIVKHILSVVKGVFYKRFTKYSISRFGTLAKSNGAHKDVKVVDPKRFSEVLICTKAELSPHFQTYKDLKQVTFDSHF